MLSLSSLKILFQNIFAAIYTNEICEQNQLAAVAAVVLSLSRTDNSIHNFPLKAARDILFPNAVTAKYTDNNTPVLIFFTLYSQSFIRTIPVLR